MVIVWANRKESALLLTAIQTKQSQFRMAATSVKLFVFTDFTVTQTSFCVTRAYFYRLSWTKRFFSNEINSKHFSERVSLSMTRDLTYSLHESIFERWRSEKKWHIIHANSEYIKDCSDKAQCAFQFYSYLNKKVI